MSAPPSQPTVPSTRALREFLATEVVGGVLLLVATLVALVWANSPWQASYASFWHTDLGIDLGRFTLHLDLRDWVNDGLMAIFFLVVGLEVKRELLVGELRTRRSATLPVVAAVGGMVVPALVYLAVNGGQPGGRGWGIPMATDIAFALGVLALVARRIPPSLRLFLLALAIVDDIGAILVIAVVYTSSIEWGWLLVAVLGVALVVVLRRMRWASTPFFVVTGCLIWVALHAAGVHATLAGVVMGLLVPASARFSPEFVDTRSEELLDVSTPAAVEETAFIARHAVSPLERLEHHLHGWSSGLIVPVFALANAGVPLGAEALRGAVTSRVSLGILLGLVVGKLVGIAGASWIAIRTGVADLPEGATWRQLLGVAALGGIGFTVSLFIVNLALDDASLAAEAKVGILAASLLASGLGAALLRLGPDPLDEP
jgi:NhaA family Na+:H+ antiporter